MGTEHLAGFLWLYIEELVIKLKNVQSPCLFRHNDTVSYVK